MSDAVWTLLHLAGDAALLYTASRSTLGSFFWLRSKRHDAIMRRIAILERDLGLGLDWTREWVQTKRVKTVAFGYSNEHGEQWCTLCGEKWPAWHGRWGNTPHPLCPDCERKTAA